MIEKEQQGEEQLMEELEDLKARYIKIVYIKVQVWVEIELKQQRLFHRGKIDLCLKNLQVSLQK